MDPITLTITLFVIATSLAGLWRVFEKVGRPGWQALIPFYNIYIIIKISGNSAWWLGSIFLPLLPVAYIQYLYQTNPLQFANPVTTPPSLEFAAMTFLFLLLFVITVEAIVLSGISRLFNRGLAFALGLTWLPFIFWPLLGFSDMQPEGVEVEDDSSEDEEESGTDHEDDGDEHHEDHHDHGHEDHHDEDHEGHHHEE